MGCLTELGFDCNGLFFLATSQCNRGCSLSVFAFILPHQFTSILLLCVILWHWKVLAFSVGFAQAKCVPCVSRTPGIQVNSGSKPQPWEAGLCRSTSEVRNKLCSTLLHNLSLQSLFRAEPLIAVGFNKNSSRKNRVLLSLGCKCS